MKYNFEWDPKKARQNLLNHKLNFECAAELFLDDRAISIFDEEHSLTEDRWVTIGKDRNDNVIAAVHTFYQEDSKNCKIRLISVRKATKKEMKQYEGNK